MDYDVVRASVQDAYKNFGQNDSKFYSAMSTFYKEGQKNPCVAKIIMQDNVIKNRKAASQMLKDAAELTMTETPSLLYPELLNSQHRAYALAAGTAIKSLSAEDLYKNSETLSETIYSEGRKEFDAKWNELYPRSGKKRQSIINSNRIQADNVTPKAGWNEKLYYAKTIAEYKQDYPKTFNARYFLISNGQITEDGVTSSVKGWFKRFMYKKLIKGGFCFKK